MTRCCLVFCTLVLAAGCGEEPVNKHRKQDIVLKVDPVGTWHVDRVVLRYEETYGPYTGTQTFPYGTGTSVEDLFLEFHDDGVLIADDVSERTELAWEATGRYTLEVTGDIDWESWNCTLSDTDDDAMSCVLADPDAELTLEATR